MCNYKKEKNALICLILAYIFYVYLYYVYGEQNITEVKSLVVCSKKATSDSKWPGKYKHKENGHFKYFNTEIVVQATES